jgi:hypothetical protein
VNFIILDDGQLSYHTPLPIGDVVSLQDLLSASNCLVPSFIGADAYSVETYIVQYANYRTQTTFLFDRNLYSQVVTLAKGSRINAKTCFAAAVMAFASCATAQIEPNLALYKGSASGAHQAWRRDLEIFYGAEDIHPANWAALTKTHELTVLCSRDKVLLNVAELLRSTVLEAPVSPFQQVGFGKSVLDRYNLYVSDLSNPIRALAPLPAEIDDYTAKLVADLEAEFLKPL